MKTEIKLLKGETYETTKENHYIKFISLNDGWYKYYSIKSYKQDYKGWNHSMVQETRAKNDAEFIQKRKITKILEREDNGCIEPV